MSEKVGAPTSTTLQRGAVGLVGAATLGAIMMSPALGLYGNWGPLAQDIGVISPLIFALGLLIALPSAISYASIARVMPSSGSAYTWLWRALTPAAGIFIGWILIGYYIVAVILQPYLFGLYFNELLSFLGITGVSTYIGGAIGVLLVTGVAAIFVYSGIQVSVRGTVILILFESLVAGGLALTVILTKAGQGDLSFAPFDPGQIGGAKDIGLALIIMVLSYTGFDVISTVAEETRSPRTLIPRATIIALFSVAAFWIFGTWGLSIAVPMSQVNDLVNSGVTPVTPIAKQYWGGGEILVILTAFTATTGVFIACAIGSTRVLYAMGREGTLPLPLGRLHPRFKTPWNATHLVFVFSLFATLVWPFWLDGNFLASFVWWAGCIAFFALVTYLFVNLANILYFTRIQPEQRNIVTNVIAPIIGLIVDAYVLYKAFFESLWNVEDWRQGPAIILFCLLMAILGIAYVFVLRMRRPALFAQQALVFDESVAPPATLVDGADA
jgi:putrescine importer